MGDLVLIAARESFTSGLRVVAAASALVLPGVAVLALTTLAHGQPLGAAHPAESGSRATAEVMPA